MANEAVNTRNAPKDNRRYNVYRCAMIGGTEMMCAGGFENRDDALRFADTVNKANRNGGLVIVTYGEVIDHMWNRTQA
jgi:hypothetical protein